MLWLLEVKMVGTEKFLIKRIFKLIVFIGVGAMLLFFITWQNLKVYLLEREINKLVKEKSHLEEEIYLDTLKLSEIASRKKIKEIAVEEFGMVPVTYRDVKLIAY